MKHSCGIIFYQNGKILVGHTTGQKHWDLPKGKAEPGETYKEAAIRECLEETSFTVQKRNLLYLGNVRYRKGKRLVLYLYINGTAPDIKDLKCTSTYTNSRGDERPELDKFKYIDLKDSNIYLTSRMCSSINEALIQFKININRNNMY